MSKRWIAFGLLPAAWGLKGETREIAKAEYELEGKELEIKKAKIRCEEESVALSTQLLAIDLKHGDITPYDYDLQTTALDCIDNKDEGGLDLKFALLKIEKKHKKITPTEYDKQHATLHGKPWVSVLSVETDEEQPNRGSLELDWNDEFVSYLQEHGYIGPTEETIVDTWLGELCKNIALEHYSGVGTFDDDVDATIQPTPDERGNRTVK